MGTEKVFWLWEFLGRLHPLAVHFPVSLLLLAAILELFTLKNAQSKLRTSISILIFTGSASAVIAALLGWLLYRHGQYSGNVLAFHQWFGFITAGLAVLLSAVVWYRPGKMLAYRTILFTTAIAVSVAGHFGASLTHGDNYLSETLPWNKNDATTTGTDFDMASVVSDTVKLTKQQELELNTGVRAILAHTCYKCHGAEKIKGGLRLDGKSFAMKGGENGAVIVPGNAAESELFRRISLPADHKEVMPSKGQRLADKDIALIKLWINKGAPWPDDSSSQNIYRVAEMAPRNPPLPAAVAGLNNPIDLWTNQYFSKNNIPWPQTISDRLYLRRIYLDIVGLLPSITELEEFEKDTQPNKKERWVRKLLDRTDDYATHWLSFWNDALRNDYSGTGYITGGRFDITNWLYQSLKNNKPYNQFVQELINPTDASKGFIAGIQWRGVVNASQRTEMQAAQNVSQVFLALNLKCASCHNSFISDWKLTDAYAFANIFADSSLEINRCDKPTGKYVDAAMLWKELGTINSQASVAEKRKQLAEYLVKPEDGRLYRTIVNRIWAQMMGRGMVEPVDVMDNAPWYQDMLDWLAFNFSTGGSDMKELIYQIAISKTYQLPSVGFKEISLISDPGYKFKGMVRRRMTAEQFTDAVSSLISPMFVAADIKYDPFAANNNITKPPFIRASLVANNGFLTALGRPNRETVATSRDSQANLLQALELTNGGRFNAVLKQGAQQWSTQYKESSLLIKGIYNRALGREPTTKELALAEKTLGTSPSVDAIQDLFWAVILLPEFQIIY